MTPLGLPHSDIHGSKRTSRSPWLFAGNRVLRRLTVARHPPYALGYLLLVSLFPWRDDNSFARIVIHTTNPIITTACNVIPTQQTCKHTPSDFASCSHNFSFTFYVLHFLLLLLYYQLLITGFPVLNRRERRKQQQKVSKNLGWLSKVLSLTQRCSDVSLCDVSPNNLHLLGSLMNIYTNAHLCSQSLLSFFENTTLVIWYSRLDIALL